LAVFAAECADAGIDVESTMRALDELITETRTFGLLDDLRFAVRGGRIPQWVKTVADLLRLQVIIRTYPDGRVASGRFQLGRRRNVERFARYIGKESPQNKPLHVAVGHALNPEGAKQLAECLRQEISDVHRLTISEIGSALGVHAGPGSLVVATQPRIVPADLPR
jgi:DegV family protein with EDD domain